ncbi:MAG: hypothetical protein JOZ77_05145 [Candidatus Eremiobacteraeota bacterium]|nr:hypothetical protein [Candidatus Eremiobacteraeota bacterium]
MTAVSAVAIADAGGHMTFPSRTVRSDKVKTCDAKFETGCVEATSTGLGSGFLGTNTSQGDGVDGTTTGPGNGVSGTSSGGGYGVSGGSDTLSAGVEGFNGSSASTGGPGVNGLSSSGPGVTGESESPSGGVEGTNTNTGDGVDGTAAKAGSGVFGASQSGYGVLGQSSAKDAGVGGFSFSKNTSEGAAGVYGQSLTGIGVYGFSQSSSSYGLYSQGNAFVDGELYTEGSCKNGCSRNRGEAAFAARTSQPTIDDIGESELRHGVAHVALAADFANTIDSNKPYVVLLTPEGDAALYVASRTATGFEVRQIAGGHSSISFAYRIVAKPYGLKDERLPFKALPDAATFKQPRIRHNAG